MTVIFYLLLIAFAGVSVAYLLLNASAQRLANAARLAVPVITGLVGLATMLAGRIPAGAIMVIGAVALGWMAAGRRPATRAGQSPKSTVRSAALEMELDHQTGDLEGIILAGPNEGKMLSQIGLEELLELHAALSGDADSTQLLEAYLDGRFPLWRDHVHAYASAGAGGAESTGAMTEQEAYKVLGLEAGATSSDIREAHRRLMQRVHPDIGGSSFLAARINEAKDILLKRHG